MRAFRSFAPWAAVGRAADRMRRQRSRRSRQRLAGRRADHQGQLHRGRLVRRQPERHRHLRAGDLARRQRHAALLRRQVHDQRDQQRRARRATPLGKVWVENLAASLGIVVTPAEVGFGGDVGASARRRRSPALASTCTAYGQGGSRVTDPNGIGHADAAR